MTGQASPGTGPRGVLLVVSSPSGAGKTTLCSLLREEFPALCYSVSYTTRPPRPGERDGVEYHFVDRARFQEMIAGDEFAEYAMVHGNMYGTPARQVADALKGGCDLLFDIDYQGGSRLRQRFPDEAVLVFILPPNLEALERRLKGRGTDSEQVIERRVRVARKELRHYAQYDYLVMNDEVARAYGILRAIYLAQIHVRQRQAPLAEQILSGQGRLL